MENKKERRGYSVLSGLSFLVVALAFIGTYFGNLVKTVAKEGNFVNFSINLISEADNLILFALFLALAVVVLVGCKNASILVAYILTFGYIIGSRICFMVFFNNYFSFGRLSNLMLFVLSFILMIVIIGRNISKKADIATKNSTRAISIFPAIIMLFELIPTIVYNPISKFDKMYYAIKDGEDFDVAVYALSALKDASMILIAFGILFLGLYIIGNKKEEQ